SSASATSTPSADDCRSIGTGSPRFPPTDAAAPCPAGAPGSAVAAASGIDGVVRIVLALRRQSPTDRGCGLRSLALRRRSPTGKGSNRLASVEARSATLQAPARRRRAPMCKKRARLGEEPARARTPPRRGDQFVGGGARFGVDEPVVMITSTDTALSCFSTTLTLNFDSRNAIVSGRRVSAPL